MNMKVLQVVGYKNAGKTTLVCEIVRMLSAEGARVATLKRDAHRADPEPAGVDTRLHREAGAFLSCMVSDARTMWVREQPAELDALLSAAAQAGADIAVVEGFKTAPYPKIAILRDADDADLLRQPGIIALVSHTLEVAAIDAKYPAFIVSESRYERLLAFLRNWCFTGKAVVQISLNQDGNKWNM